MKETCFFTKFFIIFALLFQLGCSGGGGDDGDVVGTGLDGTAAVGSPIANKTVYLKDASGAKQDTTTDSDGKFSFKDVSKLTPPFLNPERELCLDWRKREWLDSCL